MNTELRAKLLWATLLAFGVLMTLILLGEGAQLAEQIATILSF